MPAKIVTQKRLKELLEYCPETGVFTRLIATTNSVQIGDVAGGLNLYGYILISIDYRKYFAHRLAFLYMAGNFPANQTDHINHVRDDNRWKNLREVTHVTNGRNQSMRSTNKSGIMGVGWHKRDSKWRAYIDVNGKHKFLGFFTDIKDAIEARKAAEIKYGFHQNHGL